VNARRAVPRRPAAPVGAVLALDVMRIERALARRTRYRYVQPRVQALDGLQGLGWTIVSPNCSRNIDPDGGDIDIAWFEPRAGRPGQPGLWRLHRRDHAKALWVLQAERLTLEQALALVCDDPLGVWWP
jgi:hypothetical protein